ncbi:hypothetical protein [Psychromicrobium xiongbiense]|uniref:hypothetical protein n=1 Tax=Psychromicrobium xiongbiense TaxID=3051184 RepID=UPI002552EDAE|nr:hypothetical protein [Psychromicrobium sp. YIM S02556]
MLSHLAVTAITAAAESEAPAPLFMPFWMFGVAIFAIMLLLLFITVSFSNVGNRHAATEEEPDPHRQHTNKHDHSHH